MKNNLLRTTHGILLLGLLGLAIMLGGCHGNDATSEKDKTRVVQASVKPVTSPIYFNAFVEPLSVIKVTTPVEGTIDAIHFGYGETIQAGQVLIEITSETLGKDYQDKLFKYLKAKQEYQTNKTAWENTQELERFGLVSKNDYTAAKNSLADSTLGMLQAKQDLQSVLETLEIDTFDFDKLDIQNTQDAVTQLSQKFNKIQIKSPGDGIALLPNQSNKDKDKLTQGGPINKNEILLAVGDMAGITLNINVNETQIEQISPNQPVQISFIAYPQIILEGRVQHIDTQAQSKGSNDNPTFPVQIVVQQLPEKYKQTVLVGMSAKLKLEQNVHTALMVPIEAVYQKDNKSFVNVLKNDLEAAVPTEVSTGPTNLSEVAITSGLKPGDNIEISGRIKKDF